MNLPVLGALGGTELAVIGCVLVLLLALVWTWNRQQQDQLARLGNEQSLTFAEKRLESRIDELIEEVARVRQEVVKLDPELFERRDKNFKELLRSLLQFNDSLQSPKKQGVASSSESSS